MHYLLVQDNIQIFQYLQYILTYNYIAYNNGNNPYILYHILDTFSYSKLLNIFFNLIINIRSSQANNNSTDFKTIKSNLLEIIKYQQWLAIKNKTQLTSWQALKAGITSIAKSIFTSPTGFTVLATSAITLLVKGYDTIIGKREKLSRTKIETLNDDVSKYDEEIKYLEELQDKLESAKGNKSELAQIQNELNNAIGETLGLLNGEGNAYAVANAKLKANIELKKQQREQANKDKINVSKELFDNNVFEVDFGIDINAASMRQYAKKYNKSIETYNNLPDNHTIKQQYTTADDYAEYSLKYDSVAPINFDDLEWASYWNEQVQIAYNAFSSVIEDYDGVGGQEFIKNLINSMVRGGADWSEISTILQEVISNEELQNTINSYWESLVDSDIDSEQALLKVKNAFDNIITKHPNLENFFDSFYEQVVACGKVVEDTTLGIYNINFFKSFDNSTIGERLQYITNQFNNGLLSHKEYFDALQSEIENVDFSNYTGSIEEANAASQQFFTDSVQQTANGLSKLINDFDSGEMSVSEYLEGYLSIANTLSTLTDDLQENSSLWNKNNEAISHYTSSALDNTQSQLHGAINTIKSYQDSIYSLEQILTHSVNKDTVEFSTHANIIAQDLYNIIQTSGFMADEIANTLGTNTEEIAKNLNENVSNQYLACQAIMGNTNIAIQNMATAIGELFDTLGTQISNFKVDLSFGIENFSLKEVALGVLGVQEMPEIKFSLKASGESLESIGSAVSNLGKSFASNYAPQTISFEDFYSSTTKKDKNNSDTSNPSSPKITKQETDLLSDLNSELSDLNQSYETVKEARETYDKYGKITLDQAQELINTDLRLLALMGNEESAYASLTDAKLEEMKVQLARNALNTLNSLETEADAVEYLAKANVHLRDQTLSANHAMLQQAFLAKQGMQGAMADAANTIWQGYQNAVSMIDRVDIGFDLSEADKSTEETETKIEEFKKQYNWIENLLDKLSKITEKWKDSSERFFTWWEKNAAVNKAITANQDELNANQNAYAYYQQKANQVGLSTKYRTLIETGSLNIEDITDEALSTKIDEYQEWYDKMSDCKDTIDELYAQERDLIRQKLDNVIEYYSDMDSYLSSVTGKLESLISLNDSMGKRTSLTVFFPQWVSLGQSIQTVCGSCHKRQTDITGISPPPLRAG